MTLLAFKAVLLASSAACFYWGLRIIFSDSYFARWQKAYWKESDGSEWSSESVKYNRYVRTLGTIGLGLGLLYLVFFK